MTFFLLSFIIFICFVWMCLGLFVLENTTHPKSTKQWIVWAICVGPLGIAIAFTILTIIHIIGLLGVFFNCLGKLYGATVGAVASMIASKIRDYYNN